MFSAVVSATLSDYLEYDPARSDRFPARAMRQTGLRPF